jgi:hypothetical protein
MCGACDCVSTFLEKQPRCVLCDPSAAAAVLCWQAYKGLKALVSAAILTHIDPATGTNPCFDALGYSQGSKVQERGLGPLPAAAEAAEEVLCSATVHVPQLVADGLDVQVGGAGQQQQQHIARAWVSSAAVNSKRTNKQENPVCIGTQLAIAFAK